MLEDVGRRRITLGSGVEIALLDWGGRGPLALLHHANGFCAGLWGLVAERLRPHFHLVAMDARGHGESSKPPPEPRHYAWERFGEDAGEVARRLSDEHGAPIALGLGHSFGGTALMMAAAAAPERFERLVLVDPVLASPAFFAARAALASKPSTSEENRDLSTGARRRRQSFESRAEAREGWASRKAFAAWQPRALDLYAQFGLRERAEGGVELACPSEIEATIFDQARVFDVLPVAARVRTPTRMLCAERGNFPRAIFDQVAARMADARVIDVAAGHLVPMERPELVVDAVLDWYGLGGEAQRSTG
jgi:pimeloyl-ACP methyl ester carboxylesterase